MQTTAQRNLAAFAAAVAAACENFNSSTIYHAMGGPRYMGTGPAVSETEETAYQDAYDCIANAYEKLAPVFAAAGVPLPQIVC